MKWGLETADYLRTANDETLIIPLLETREAVEQVESILRVDGLEAIYFGPADISASYGFLGQWEGGPVADSILAMRELATARGIASGILARSRDEAIQRQAEGFQMIALGADVNLMMSAIRDTLNAVHNSAP